MADDASMKWYAVHTYSGYENKVKANLEQSIQNNNLQDLIEEVSIPTEETLEIKNGKSHITVHKRMPGYVFVRMKMTNRSWYFVRNTTGVTGFVSTGEKATAIPDEEYEALVSTASKPRLDVQVGDDVRVLGGVFADSIAKVTEIDPETKRVTVVMQLFGKETKTELGLDEVVRVEF